MTPGVTWDNRENVGTEPGSGETATPRMSLSETIA